MGLRLNTWVEKAVFFSTKKKKKVFFIFPSEKTPTKQRKCRRQKEQAKKRLPTPWRRSARRCNDDFINTSTGNIAPTSSTSSSIMQFQSRYIFVFFIFIPALFCILLFTISSFFSLIKKIE